MTIKTEDRDTDSTWMKGSTAAGYSRGEVQHAWYYKSGSWYYARTEDDITDFKKVSGIWRFK